MGQSALTCGFPPDTKRCSTHERKSRPPPVTPGARMQEIFQQLEGYFVGAVPTSLLFIVLVLAYQFLVQGPLTSTLKERRARTEGAVEAAHKAIERAEARAAEYAT